MLTRPGVYPSSARILDRRPVRQHADHHPSDEVLLDDAVEIGDGHPVVKDAIERVGRPFLLDEDVGPARTMPEAVLVDDVHPVLQAPRPDGLGKACGQLTRPAPVAAGRTAAYDD